MAGLRRVVTSVRCTLLLHKRNAHSQAGLLKLWNDLLTPADAHLAAGSHESGARAWASADTLLKDQLRAFKEHVDGTLLPEQVHLNLMAFYQGLQPEQRAPFLALLASTLDVQESEINLAISQWKEISSRTSEGVTSSVTLHRAAEKLRAAAQPLYTQLFGPISREPGGIPFLVSMRAHVREALDQGEAAGGGRAALASLRALDTHLKQALSNWFSPGLLECRRVTWQSSPAVLLEKLMQYEAVHAVHGWEDLKQRLGVDRRVHGYFHPCLPGEPLVILHAALMQQVPATMAEVLRGTGSATGAQDSNAPTSQPSPTVAAFYSISSTQPGLSGVDLGHFLIIQVAKKIQAELPSVKQLVTLSPLSGFRPWLQSQLAATAVPAGPSQHAAAHAPHAPSRSSVDTATDDDGATNSNDGGGGAAVGAEQWVDVAPQPQQLPPLIQPEEARHLQLAAQQLLTGQPLVQLQAVGGSAEAALQLLLESPVWCDPGAKCEDPVLLETRNTIQRLLLRAAARYLLLERRRSLALDSVAHFHLRNGAQLLRVNSRADMTPSGIQRSYGLMVNYQYDLAAAEANNRAYLVDHVIRTHRRVLNLLDL